LGIFDHFTSAIILSSIIQDGASAIARGIAHNTTLESINLMNQTHSRWGDKCLDDFLEMFNFNMTLLKVHNILIDKHAIMFDHSWMSADQLAARISQKLRSQQNDHAKQRDRPTKEEWNRFRRPASQRPAST
jgi:hypothetical protein